MKNTDPQPQEGLFAVTHEEYSRLPLEMQHMIKKIKKETDKAHREQLPLKDAEIFFDFYERLDKISEALKVLSEELWSLSHYANQLGSIRKFEYDGWQYEKENPPQK